MKNRLTIKDKQEGEENIKKSILKVPKITKPKKPKPPKRNSSSYSIVSLSEVTEGALQVWRALPEKIRQDPSLASFRQEHERLHGELFFNIFLINHKHNRFYCIMKFFILFC